MASGLTVAAQVPDQFTVSAPSWQEGALIVNNAAKTARVFKNPSAQSAYFVYNPSKLQDGQTAKDVGLWGTATASQRYTSPQGASPVVGKSTGWVQLYGAGPQRADGWVQSRFTSISPKVNITEENVAADPDLCELYGMVFHLQYDASQQTATIHIGKLKDGVLVFPYTVSDMPISTIQTGTASVGENDDYYYLELTRENIDRDGYPVIQTFPSSLLASLLDKATPAEHPLILFNTQAALLRVPLR